MTDVQRESVRVAIEKAYAEMCREAEGGEPDEPPRMELARELTVAWLVDERAIPCKLAQLIAVRLERSAPIDLIDDLEFLDAAKDIVQGFKPDWKIVADELVFP